MYLLWTKRKILTDYSVAITKTGRQFVENGRQFVEKLVENSVAVTGPDTCRQFQNPIYLMAFNAT